MQRTFDLQGHRGGRAGCGPENTLPSFEAAFDIGVTTVETDLHLTRDDVVVLSHDPFLTSRLCRELAPNALPLANRPSVRSLTLAQIRCYAADQNPDPARFRDQTAAVTPVAQQFAAARAINPFAVPTLADLFDFASAYAGSVGASAGKTPEQRARARRVRFDLELKRVPFHPEYIGDGYHGAGPGLLERQVLTAVRAANVVARTTVRSFDHRCVAHLLKREPGLMGAVLIEGTAPLRPSAVAWEVGATLYCPKYEFVDAELVGEAHAGGVRIVPWTVNEDETWRKLFEMGVDGITTDYPDRLAAHLREWDAAW